MSYFNDVKLTYQGHVLIFTAGEGKALEERVFFAWNRRGDHSSWLAVATFEAIQRKYKEVPQQVMLELASIALGISAADLVSTIQWHENYMRWHDGDPTYHMLEDD